MRFNFSELINNTFQWGKSSKRKLLFLFTLFSIYNYLFISKSNSGVILLILVSLWWQNMNINKNGAQITFLFAIALLGLTSILLMYNSEVFAEKVSIFAFMMLMVGTIQRIVEIKYKDTNLRDYDYYLTIFIQYRFVRIVLISIGKLSHYINRKIARFINFYFNTVPTRKIDHLFNGIKFTFLVIIIIYIYLLSSNLVTRMNRYIAAEREKQYRISLNPVISSIEPLIVYAANKVVIYGKNFGWKEKGSSLVMKEGGKTEKVVTELWTDSKIIFVVPLDWKNKTAYFWINKQVRWNGKIITTKSMRVSIKVIPRTSQKVNNTPDDDAYFEQLKTLSPETLKINGYE